MLCAKFGRNWLSGSGEEFFLISSMYFHYFIMISPLKRAGPFIWTKLNTLHPRMHCCKFWLKLAQWFWRRFFKFRQCILLFRNYLPWEKASALQLNKLESPSPKNTLCQVWLKLAQWFWRRRWKCEKFTTMQTTTRTTTTITDNGHILIRKAHLSLLLRWAKNRKWFYLLKK